MYILKKEEERDKFQQAILFGVYFNIIYEFW